MNHVGGEKTNISKKETNKIEWTIKALFGNLEREPML